MVTLEQIKSAIPTLSNYELGELRQQITVLLSLGGQLGRTPGEKDSTDYTDEDFVLQSVCRMVRLSNGSPVQPQMLKRAGSLMALLRQHLPYLMKFIEPIDPVSRPGFLDAAVQLLVDNIKQQGIPVTPAVVIRQLQRIPAVVDQAFPGYYQAGRLNMIVREKGK